MLKETTRGDQAFASTCKRGRTRLAAATAAALAALPVAAQDAERAVFNRPTNSSAIAISRDDRLIWAVNPRDDTVSVIRSDNHTVLATINVGDEPRGVAVDPNNTFAYVANAAANTVSVIRIDNATFGSFDAQVIRTIRTGAEPWDVVVSPDGRRVFVANSGQDTISVINALTRNLIGNVDIRNSLCNDPDRRRHFQPRGLAVTQNNRQLYTARFLSYTRPGGRQGRDAGKEGIICRLNINTVALNIGAYQPAQRIALSARRTGFVVDKTGDGVADDTVAFPNQLQSIVIRGNRAFMPNIAASPEGPLVFNVDTQAFLNYIGGVGGANQTDANALNLHRGAVDPETGKKRLFFANPWGIAFTNQTGAGKAYVISAGSDLLVKLNISAAGVPRFTEDVDTTRYIDLNDPENPATAGLNGGKNPIGIAINSAGTRAYTANNVSGNVSVVNLVNDTVIDTVQTGNRPAPGSIAERVLVGAEMFFSSRGHFDRPPGTSVSTDERLSSEGWQNCASCHFNGWTDGVVWAFGAGPRKSVSLAGSFNPNNPDEQKVLNYSAIFDEVEDFEANIRNVSGPGNNPVALACSDPPPDTSLFRRTHGLMIGDNGDVDFAPCVINAFTKSNAGRQEITVTPPGSSTPVKALTALRLWVQLAVRPANGPLSSNEIADGVPIAQINAGRALFRQARCTNCHNGGLWSSSLKDFASPPPGGQIACEVDLTAAAAPPGSLCRKPPLFGDPIGAQFLPRFLENIGSYNLGVLGQGNHIEGNVGAQEKAAPALVNGVAQLPPKDGLGLDFNQDGRGLGFNVQSLLGVNSSPPYIHNGACETLACVVNQRNHRTANRTLPDVLNTGIERANVVRFLESIDADTAPFP
jgi:YVTN family beta-propeller protein